MSIIERMAELLGPVTSTNSKSSAPVGQSGALGLDLIERAVSESSASPEPGGHAAQPVAASRAVEPKADAKPSPVSRLPRTTRSVKVNFDRLRRQGIIAPGGERTPTAECFRRIKRKILANVAAPDAESRANLVLVTSAVAGEGKTFCAINLAISIALEVDHSVLLVDADVRRPSIPRVLGLKVGKGLMDLLADRRLDVADVLHKIEIGKLTLLPSGTENARATELLASGATRDLLREMAERYHDRIIIFDSPPLLASSETDVLASQVGQIVIVVDSGKTTESTLKEALGRIDLSKKPTSLLLNKVEGYGLRSYRGYGNGRAS